MFEERAVGGVCPVAGEGAAAVRGGARVSARDQRPRNNVDNNPPHAPAECDAGNGEAPRPGPVQDERAQVEPQVKRP
ncbi:hypothetical protein, partial [Stenotrophomonas sp. SrG]|uniref:hypothetical protein n=1 Tax=Stenotrophomonas sp. SrG TaxID=3414430 RepID=UPI003CF38EE7